MKYKGYFYGVDYSNYFSHYGRLGMKWGQHVYRSVEVGNAIGRNANRSRSDVDKLYDSVSGIKKQQRARNIDVSKMSDQELKEKINRMNLEQRYIELTSSQKSKGEIYTKRALEIGGASLGLISAGLGSAVAVQTLRRNWATKKPA